MQVAERETDEAFMRRALALSARGARAVRPNPLVGTVLVRDGDVVGEGRTAPPPGPHAEVVALRQAGERARGATAYVTLEPCAHSGRTPPCTEALIEAGVVRVVVAARDPHPLASGGVERLRAAGVEVITGVADVTARHRLRVFLHDVDPATRDAHGAHARPFVTLKAATSLDGRIAAADGTSQWLTGTAARAEAHALRAEVDAILVGSGTALADDPRLTVRLPDAPADGELGAPPLRVLLDGRGRVNDGHLLDGTVSTLVVTTEGAAHPAEGRQNVEVAHAPVLDGHLDLAAVLALLRERDVRHLLVEGGAAVAGALMRGRLVDELVLHLAPLLLGGAGRPLLDGDGITTLAGAFRLEPVGIQRAGDDTLLTLLPSHPPTAGVTPCSPAS